MVDIDIKHINYTLTRPELLRLNKYFVIIITIFVIIIIKYLFIKCQVI